MRSPRLSLLAVLPLSLFAVAGALAACSGVGDVIGSPGPRDAGSPSAEAGHPEAGARDAGPDGAEAGSGADAEVDGALADAADGSIPSEISTKLLWGHVVDFRSTQPIAFLWGTGVTAADDGSSLAFAYAEPGIALASGDAGASGGALGFPFSPTGTPSAPTSWGFIPTFVMPPDTHLRAATRDVNGTVYLAGSGTQPAVGNDVARSHAYMIAYAPNGAIVAPLEATVDSPATLDVTSIAPAPGGGVVVAGIGMPDLGCGTPATGDQFVARLNGSLRCVWAAAYDAPRALGPSVAVDASGNVTVIVPPDFTIADAAKLVRFDAKGAKQWDHALGSVDTRSPVVALAVAGTDVLVARSPRGDAGTATTTVELLAGADAAPLATMPLGPSPDVTASALVSDGANGAWVAGATTGATLGAFALAPGADGACYVAHVTPAGVALADEPVSTGSCRPRGLALGANAVYVEAAVNHVTTPNTSPALVVGAYATK